MLSTPLVVASIALVVPPPVSFESLLQEMTDRAALARFPDPEYTCAQSSSYDRASTSPAKSGTWFANNDFNQFLRVEENSGRKEWVMLDQPGPGAVVRIWSANPKGVMRVYIDGDAKPVLEGPMSELLGGRHPLIGSPLAQESARGFNLYLPIPYAKHCKVTSDNDGFYYQVNYRTYEKGAAVVSFNATDIARAASAINDVNRDLTLGVAAPHQNLPNLASPPGSEFDATSPTGPRAITQLTVVLDASDMEQATRSTVLEATFDDIETIWCPIGDLFGSGVGLNEYHDNYRAVSNARVVTCRWVMPYARSASMKLLNLGDQPIRASITTMYDDWSWDDRSMHFYARWHSEYPIHVLGARGTKDFNYVDIQGRGVFVGDNLSVMNPVPEWWGEGDEKIYVDGETFPSHFGTGTEDYYGYAWCAPVKFEHPFHAQPRVDGEKYQNNYGHTSVTRVRSLDAIPFTKSLKFDMEVWHWKECDVAYASTVYFYARPGATHNRPPDPAAAAAAVPQPPPLPPPFVIPGAIECEAMSAVGQTPGLVVTPQGMGSFKPRTWSGDSHLWVQGKKVGDFVELRVPCKRGERVNVTLHATKSWDYGIIRFSIDGIRIGDDKDLFSGGQGKVGATGPIDLGAIEPAADSFVLRAEVVGGNGKALGTKAYFGLDCVVISLAK